MSTHTHDNQCDSGQPCEMCSETDPSRWEPPETPCRLCGRLTPMLGTKLCNRCWELETRIQMDPVLTKQILDSLAEPKASESSTNHAGTCCPDCDNDDRERPAIPNFEDDWVRSTPLRRRLIERDDAYYFWLKGQQAGRIAEQVETQGWLSQMVEGYSERVGR